MAIGFMDILRIESLRKEYPGFTLDDVTFSLEPGYIMGLIGRNGAGKTTAIKATLGLISRDGGRVFIDGTEFTGSEKGCKDKIGFVMGEFDYYKYSRIGVVANVVKRFYRDWDDDVYRTLIERFALDESKKVNELSAGMRVKFSLALALSHNAKLLMLDEPTSGLDPVSRDELLDVFRSVIADGTRSILFSTHIISDLEKCADYITFIHEGRLLLSSDIESFKAGYMLVSGDSEDLERFREHIIGAKKHAFGFTGLIKAEDAVLMPELKTAPADLETIMIFNESGVKLDA